MAFHVPEKFRIVRNSAYATSAAKDGNNGAFLVTLKNGTRLKVIVSDGADPDGPPWEHVSVSRTDRCPLWSEMCEIKDMFWDDDDCVVQYHPPRADWISNHTYCLHMWRPVGIELPRPPSIMVGIAELGTLT